MNTLELLDRLIAFPTISADSNLPLIDFVRGYLAERGFECRLVPDEGGLKANLFATIGPKQDDGIVLSGHTDVVPVTTQAWTTDPFRLTRRGTRLHGRGTTDMKGFLASVLSAADRIDARALKRPLHIAFSHDEEIGCVGVRSLIDLLAEEQFKASLCIVGEPTSMAIALGHKGKMAAQARFRGEAGHSSLAPRFVNAIHLACDFVGTLRAVQREIAEAGRRDAEYDIPYTTVHAGKISGGEVLNIVAERASVEFEIRHLAEDKVEEISSRIASLAGSAAEIDFRNAYPGLSTSPNGTAALFAGRLLGEGTLTKVSFGTEAGLFATKLGLDTVVVGPGNMEQGHQPDEYIEEAELQGSDAMMDRLIGQLT
ncbi:acetylornithine deacetylase [Rhizobium sp. ERR 1071]|uniref:acetylornithine deacetylase n=1 Tax=Rhizobium sp. ERR 1071 TaxID=2572677 RepID=UPI00119AB3B0|nr:acetylornithine deacetylase [Rhizobium sp. ERR1071]TWB08209.1 acetylornithine deacetylase [Rhizobium sp. ERR1071]